MMWDQASFLPIDGACGVFWPAAILGNLTHSNTCLYDVDIAHVMSEAIVNAHSLYRRGLVEIHKSSILSFFCTSVHSENLLSRGFSHFLGFPCKYCVLCILCLIFCFYISALCIIFVEISSSTKFSYKFVNYVT